MNNPFTQGACYATIIAIFAAYLVLHNEYVRLQIAEWLENIAEGLEDLANYISEK